MTSRERLLKVIRGEIPDSVPVDPDTSNMIPARLTGKPFWDIYLYKNPPLWKAYIDCARYFGFDAWLDGYLDLQFEDEIDPDLKEVIVFRNDERIVTQKYYPVNGHKNWLDKVTVYYRDNPPTENVNPHAIHLPLVPEKYEPVEGIKQWPLGGELLKLAKSEMGEMGIIGVKCGTSKLVTSEQEIYDYYDNPEKYYKKRDQLLEYYIKRFHRLMSLEVKPDFIGVGGSGTLIHQTLDMFRELGLPIVKEMSALAKKYDVPVHLHSCGPEKELVKILAEETDVTIVDPLEIAPMGNCDLKELKALYGDRLVLKGNLHTTNVMLAGTADDVVNAAKKAIDDAAEGGRFILSTGDQCGRDTPDENIFALIETARTYGRY